MDGLIPVVIQDYISQQVLMQAFMNEEAYQLTIETKEVHFYSRSKNRIWKKGESSGNVLIVKEILKDCDQDALLIKVNPTGNTCHKGNYSCFQEIKEQAFFTYQLEQIIAERLQTGNESSYTFQLSKRGIDKVAQKVGEEAVELIIEAKNNDKESFLNESADLLYHYLLLLQAKGYGLEDVEQILISRNKRD